MRRRYTLRFLNWAKCGGLRDRLWVCHMPNGLAYIRNTAENVWKAWIDYRDEDIKPLVVIRKSQKQAKAHIARELVKQLEKFIERCKDDPIQAL